MSCENREKFVYITSVQTLCKKEILNDGGSVSIYSCDVSNFDEVEGLIRNTVEEFSKIDIIFININPKNALNKWFVIYVIHIDKIESEFISNNLGQFNAQKKINYSWVKGKEN